MSDENTINGEFHAAEGAQGGVMPDVNNNTSGGDVAAKAEDYETETDPVVLRQVIAALNKKNASLAEENVALREERDSDKKTIVTLQQQQDAQNAQQQGGGSRGDVARVSVGTMTEIALPQQDAQQQEVAANTNAHGTMVMSGNTAAAAAAADQALAQTLSNLEKIRLQNANRQQSIKLRDAEQTIATLQQQLQAAMSAGEEMSDDILSWKRYAAFLELGRILFSTLLHHQGDMALTKEQLQIVKTLAQRHWFEAKAEFDNMDAGQLVQEIDMRVAAFGTELKSMLDHFSKVQLGVAAEKHANQQHAQLKACMWELAAAELAQQYGGGDFWMKLEGLVNRHLLEACLANTDMMEGKSWAAKFREDIRNMALQKNTKKPEVVQQQQVILDSGDGAQQKASKLATMARARAERAEGITTVFPRQLEFLMEGGLFQLIEEKGDGLADLRCGILTFLNSKHLRVLSQVSKTCRRAVRAHQRLFLPSEDGFMREVLECLRSQQNPLDFSHVGKFEFNPRAPPPNDIDAFLPNDAVYSQFRCLEISMTTLHGVVFNPCFVLENVLKIDIKAQISGSVWHTNTLDLRNCLLHFPNLEELTISNMVAVNREHTDSLEGAGKTLRILRIEHSHAEWNADVFLIRSYSTLRELYVDHSLVPVWISKFCSSFKLGEDWLPPAGPSPLEKISCVNTMSEAGERPRLLCDWTLSRIVECSPKLKWFRSHLSKEAALALKNRFPKITFVKPDGVEW